MTPNKRLNSMRRSLRIYSYFFLPDISARNTSNSPPTRGRCNRQNALRTRVEHLNELKHQKKNATQYAARDGYSRVASSHLNDGKRNSPRTERAVSNQHDTRQFTISQNTRQKTP